MIGFFFGTHLKPFTSFFNRSRGDHLTPDEKMVLRLSPETVAVFRALVFRGDFPSMSEAIRTVLDDYADERVAEGITPAYDYEEALDIADLTSDGRTLDDMVRAAADRYISERSG